MSLRFYIGASGSGKSRRIQEEIIQRAMAEPDRHFIIVVPDQFTMQTQKEVVMRHPRHGIMNIDVQSFGRLCYRMKEELGEEERILLDDTGKNLILRHLALKLEKELPALGSSLKKTGYVHEVKSVLSEFMQYGISAGEIDKLIDYSDKKPMLKGKLKDLQKLYHAFEEYCAGRYITKEEKLDILAGDIARAESMKDSVVVFDGFTGFTPVQENVITQMLMCCQEVIFTIIMPPEELESYREENDEHRVFSLSLQTMRSLEQLAENAGVKRGKDVLLTGNPVQRYRERPALAHLEQGIFHNGCGTVKAGEEIAVFHAPSPAAELEEVFARIHKLCYQKNYAYREIAVVSGDLERYAPYAASLGARYGVPYFLDRTVKLSLNPYTEFLKGALLCVAKDYSYEAVMRLLKSGMCGFSSGEIADLENYLLGSGIRGAKAWREGFTRRPAYLRDQEKQMLRINRLRERIMELLSPLAEIGKEGKAEEYTRALYALTEKARIYGQLEVLAAEFKAVGDEVREKEYSQVYRLVLQLLEQLINLMEGEVLSIKEYQEILEAGLSEIKIGVLPQDVDRVVIGDMERTRLKPVKVLFFIGCNDGIIPKISAGGGLISDIDREYLAECGIPLAPTPRQKMYIQRLYLYHALTRPAEKLILSYADTDRGGNAIRPSYLLREIRGLYSDLTEENISLAPKKAKLENGGGYLQELSGMLSAYAAGALPVKMEPFFYTLYADFKAENPLLAGELVKNAFLRYTPEQLGEEAVEKLYGKVITNSISRMEKYADCAYAHFLQYGMRLKDRELAGLSTMDAGSFYHAVLEHFGKILDERTLKWGALTDDELESVLTEAMDKAGEEFGRERLSTDAQTAYRYARMFRILRRSVEVMRYQLGKGKFYPFCYERKFSEPVPLTGKDSGRMLLTGKIDRIDVMEEGDELYLKVVDYKSGDKELDYASLYYGDQLQLFVYLREAIRFMQERYPEKKVLPGALFYYLLKDPLVKLETGTAPDPERDGKEAVALLKMKGLISNVDAVVNGLDENHGTKSDVAVLSWNKDGALAKSSQVAGDEELKALMDFTEKKLMEISTAILQGDMSVSPLGEDACKYCTFKGTCPFDGYIGGYERREKCLGKEEARKLILKEMSEDGEEKTEEETEE